MDLVGDVPNKQYQDESVKVPFVDFSFIDVCDIW